MLSVSQAMDVPLADRAGPLLLRLLGAQDRDAASALQMALRRTAGALVMYARELGHPVLEPVSPGGHRLVGAALLLAGDVALRRDDVTVGGAHVLLVEGVALTGLPVEGHARRLRAAGAASVHAFFSDLPNGAPGFALLDASGLLDGWRVVQAA